MIIFGSGAVNIYHERTLVWQPHELYDEELQTHLNTAEGLGYDLDRMIFYEHNENKYFTVITKGKATSDSTPEISP